MTRLSACLVALILLAVAMPPAAAQSVGNNDPVITDAVTAQIAADTEARRAAYADDADIRVWPGIIANRAKRTVELDVFGTGLEPPSPIEYWLVTQEGKTYESLAVMAASPEDVRAAMAWIGMQPGRPVDMFQLYFWPRGERVQADFILTDGDGAGTTVASHDMVLDTSRRGPLPAEGWTYVGSRIEAAAEEGAEPELLATTTGDVASTFNSPYSLFDVPHRAIKEVVYGSRQPSPKHLLAFGQRLTVRLSPSLPAGQQRVQDWQLTIRAPQGADTTVQALRFDLSPVGDWPTADDELAKALASADFDGLLSRIQALYKAEKDIFLRIAYADDVPVKPLSEFLAMIGQISERDIIRIEPLADEIYYQAFLLGPEALNASTRLVHPIEITLTDPATGAGVFRKLIDVYPDGGDAYVREHRIPIADSAALQAHLDSVAEWETDTLFVIVPDSTPVAQIRAWHQPLQERFPVLFVYPQSVAATMAKENAAPPLPAGVQPNNAKPE